VCFQFIIRIYFKDTLKNFRVPKELFEPLSFKFLKLLKSFLNLF
jgi:hypothetical protein